MLNKAQNVILLLCLTSLVYILRDTNASPTGFLQKQIIRYLQDEKPSDTLCSGVDLNEEITVSQRERADSYRSALSTIRDGNRFVEFIEGPAPAGDFGKDYIVSVIKYAIPWIVFFAISVIGCLIFLFSWCCCRHSKSDRFKNCYMILGLLFLVFVAGAAIAGIVVSRSIPKGGHRTVCNSALLYEKLADGNTTENWIGIRPAADQIVVTLDSFSETVDNLDQLNDNFRQLDTSLQPALNAVAAMYNDNRDKVVQTRPNPDIAGGYTPDIINNLGPLDNPGSVTGALQVEMQTKKDVVEQAGQAIDTGVTTLKQNKQQYQADLDAGRNFAVETSNSVGEAYNKVLEFGTDANRIIDGINGALLGIFIAKLAIAAFAVLSILIVCCGAQFFNKCVHLSWCALGLIVILTWALSAVVFPLSLVLFEGCQVADKVITEPAFYNQTYDKFIGTDDSNTQKGKEVIYQCLFGDGDILAVFGLANNKINMFDPIFNALDNTANLTEAVQDVPNSIIIPIDQQLIDSMRQGTVPDSSVTVQDLGTLNEYIIRNGPQCTQNRDYWVLDASQCTTGTGTVFTIQNAAGFNMGNPTCIPLNAFLDKNINDRYTATTLPQGTCGTSDEDLSRFVDNFVQSRQEVNGILDDLSTSLAAVSSANDDFMASLKDVTQSFDPIRSDTLTIYNALANKDTGLLNNANCTFIKGSIENIRDSLCVVTVSGIFQTTIDIIVLSFMGLFATLFVFCLSRKFSVIEKEGKRMPAEAYKLPKV